MLRFDIDVKGNDLVNAKRRAKKGDTTFEPESVVTALQELYDIKDVDYEVIIRSRADKISYHIRFDKYVKKSTLLAMLREVQPGTALKHYDVRNTIDAAIYNGSLRVSTENPKFMFDPSRIPFAVKGTPA